MTRLCVLGGSGLIGSHVVHAAQAAGLEVMAPDRRSVDLSDRAAIERLVAAGRPDVIINAAGFTAVDAAEDAPEVVRAANVIGPTVLAETAQRAGAWLVQYSTDFVFGDDAPGERDEADPVSPVGVYASSKAEGERAVLAADPSALVARVGNVYGIGGRNFAAKLRGLLLARTPVGLDRERRMSPTTALAIARQTLALLPHHPCGIAHMTCHGEATWAAFGRTMAAALGLQAPPIEEKTSAALATRVHRPSVVLAKHSLARWGLDRMPDWPEAMQEYLRQTR